MSRLTSPNVLIPSATVVVAGLLALAFWKLGPTGTDTDAHRSVPGAAARSAGEAHAAQGAKDPVSGLLGRAAQADGGPAGAPGSAAPAQASQSPNTSGQAVMPASAGSGALPGWRKYEPEKSAPGSGTAGYAGSLSSGGTPSSTKSAGAKGPATATPGGVGMPAFGVRPTTPVGTTTTPPATTTPTPDPHPSPTAAPSPSPSPSGEGDSDRTPPVLDGLSFNPPQIEDGGTTTLMVSVHDDLSGVKKVSGNLRSPSGAAVISFDAQGDPGGTIFGAKIVIPKKAETGNWYVTNLFIPDQADNTLVGTYTAATTPPGGLLKVVSSESDSTPPEVRGATLLKNTVKDGDNDVISVDVQDDISGVATVSGLFQSPNKTAFIPFACHLNPDTQMWDGPFPIPGNASCGEWTIQHIRVADKAGNIATVPGTAQQLASVSFMVTQEGDCDSTPPTLDAFSLNPTVVSNEAASDIIITAQVHDDGTGTVSVIGWASGPPAANGQPPQISFSLTHRPTDPPDIWLGKITVPQYAAKGTWRIGRVRVQDKALNNRDYGPDDPVLAGAIFQVQ